MAGIIIHLFGRYVNTNIPSVEVPESRAVGGSASSRRGPGPSCGPAPRVWTALHELGLLWSLDSGRWALGGGFRGFFRPPGGGDKRVVPSREARGAGELVPFGRRFVRLASITSSPPPQRLRIGGVASRFDRFPPASPAKSDARSSPPPPRRVTCGVPAPPVRDSRSADGDRRPAVCPSVASTRRCLTENPAPACYPDHATRTNAAGTRAKLKIQMETK